MTVWGGGARVAAPAPAPARRRPARPPRPQPQPSAPSRRRAVAQRSGVFGGVLWIAVLAALLGGIVALNVAVLQLNVRLDELAQERAELRARNAEISTQLSSAGSTPQIEALARKRLGAEPASPEATTYVVLPPGQ